MKRLFEILKEIDVLAKDTLLSQGDKNQRSDQFVLEFNQLIETNSINSDFLKKVDIDENISIEGLINEINENNLHISLKIIINSTGNLTLVLNRADLNLITVSEFDISSYDYDNLTNEQYHNLLRQKVLDSEQLTSCILKSYNGHFTNEEIIYTLKLSFENKHEEIINAIKDRYSDIEELVKGFNVVENLAMLQNNLVLESLQNTTSIKEKEETFKDKVKDEKKEGKKEDKMERKKADKGKLSEDEVYEEIALSLSKSAKKMQYKIVGYDDLIHLLLEKNKERENHNTLKYHELRVSIMNLGLKKFDAFTKELIYDLVRLKCKNDEAFSKEKISEEDINKIVENVAKHLIEFAAISQETIDQYESHSDVASQYFTGKLESLIDQKIISEIKNTINQNKEKVKDTETTQSIKSELILFSKQGKDLEANKTDSPKIDLHDHERLEKEPKSSLDI